jgi:hypothetical protein
MTYQVAAALRVLTPLGMAASNFEQPPSETGAGNFAHADRNSNAAPRKTAYPRRPTAWVSG